MTNIKIKTNKYTPINRQVASFIEIKESCMYCIDCDVLMEQFRGTLYLKCPSRKCDNMEASFNYDFFLGSSLYYIDILTMCDLWLCGASVDVIHSYYQIDKDVINMYVIKMCDIIESKSNINLIRADGQSEMVEIDHSKMENIADYNTLFKRFMKWVFE